MHNLLLLCRLFLCFVLDCFLRRHALGLRFDLRRILRLSFFGTFCFLLLRRFLISLLQAGKFRRKLLIIFVAVRTCLLDSAQHFAHGIDQGEQRSGNFRLEPEVSIPEFREQTFTDMSQRFQFRKTEKAACSFNCMDRAKDAGQARPVIRLMFERYERLVQLIQVLGALHEKLSYNVV